MNPLLRTISRVVRPLRRRRLLAFVSAVSVVGLALAGGLMLVGAAHAGDEPWDQEFEYGDGQVAPGTGDWRPLQTCWRFDNPNQPSPSTAPTYGLDLDWPFCHDIEDSNGSPLCQLEPVASAGVTQESLFGIFLGDYHRVLRETGANVISLKGTDGGVGFRRDPYVVYRRPFGSPDAEPTENRFVPKDRGEVGLPNLADVRGVENSENNAPVTHTRFYLSREQYLRDLYYSRDKPGSGTASAWWADVANLRMVPARESPRFFIRWQHPDHPMGGLMTDYAYVLQQQNYLNAQLLGNIRSYSSDGHRVIYKVQSKEAVLLHGQQVGNCGVPTGTVHPHPTTCTLTGTITSHRVVYPSTIALSYDYNPAPPRFGPTPTPFITRQPPQTDVPVIPPTRGAFEGALQGTPAPHPRMTPQFQHRQAFDAGLPMPVGTNVPTAPPGFTGEQVHVPEYTYYDVARVGTYDYPYYGMWGIPWEDFGVDYHRELKEGTDSYISRWAGENLAGPDPVRSVPGAWPATVLPTEQWYLTTHTPTPRYEHVANIGEPQGTLEYSRARDEAERLHGRGEELGYRYYEGHNARRPYPTPDQLIFSDGPARQVENPFIIRDYPNTSLDAISINMELPAIYREDVFVNYSERDELLESSVRAARFGGEYAAPLFVPEYGVISDPEAERTDAISGYQQFSLGLTNYPNSCDARLSTCPHQTYGADPLRPSVYDVRGQGISNYSPADSSSLAVVGAESAYRYRWPVYFDDVSWYLFELHGVNKALADSREFARGVLDHSGFDTGDAAHYPAWALDPRMVGRPYDGMGHPVVNNAPAVPHTGGIPDIPHRYYGGGLSNYRNTVDPLEHWAGVQAMAAEHQGGLGEGFPHGVLTDGNEDGRPNATQRTDTDGYGMYTNRKVWTGSPNFAAFDGDNADYDDSDFSDGTYGGSRNHNLTFLPLKPVDGYEPGGTLVKRGVTSPKSDGSNARLDWLVYDSSPIQVHGGHELSTYQVLGMPMPGSYLFGKLQHEWPDYPLDPNRTYLLATMYYEASFLPPFYVIRDPGDHLRVEGRAPEVVGRVPRLVMRPVYCRVLIQPLGVNQGTGQQGNWFERNIVQPVTAGYNYVDDALGGAISRNLGAVKEGAEFLYEKGTEFLRNLNPVQWLMSTISAGFESVTDRSAGLICDAGQMTDYVAGPTGGEADDVGDLDEGTGNRKSRQEALQRCRELEAAQEVEAQACPEGAADGGLCGVVPKMEIFAEYADMFTVSAGGADNTEDFGVLRGFYERPHWVDGARVLSNIYTSSALTSVSPGPLQFGYFPPGRTFALPQATQATPGWSPVAGGGSFPYETSNLTPPSGTNPTTRCPTEQELLYMNSGANPPRWLPGGAPASRGSWTASGTPWERAVKSRWDAHNPRPPGTPLHPDPKWVPYPPYQHDPPFLSDEDVRQAYSDGLCAPMHVSFGCSSPPGPDGKCPGDRTGPVPWAAGASGAALVGVPVRWRAVDATSADATPNYLDVEITSLSTGYGPAHFHSGSSSILTQGAGLFRSSDYLSEHSVAYPEVYRIPAAWLLGQGSGANFTLLPLKSEGIAFGSLQGTSVRAQHLSVNNFSEYDDLCAWDLDLATCTANDYFGGGAGLMRTPTKANTVGMDPQALPDKPPLQDYRAFVNDLATVYALGPGSSYTIRVRGVLEEAAGRTTEGPWSNTLSLSSTALCGILNPHDDDYADFVNALGCGDDNSGYGAGGLARVDQVFAGSGIDWVWRMVATDVCTGFFDSTPASLTWGVPGVVRGWGIVWVISMVALVFLIFWQGVRMTYDMWMHGGWANQRDPGFREAVPRFFLAVILAAGSLLLCRLALILISNVSCYVSRSTEVGIWNILGWFLGLVVAAIAGVAAKVAGAFIFTGPGALALLAAGFSLILALIGFFLVMFAKVMLQLLIRVALLAVLIVLSPLAFILMATPDTEEWTKKWLGMFVTVSIMQTLQLLTLYLAVKVYSLFAIAGSGSGVPLFTGLVVGIVILYLVSKIPEILDRYLGRDIVSGGAAPGMAQSFIGGIDRGAGEYLRMGRGGGSGGGQQPTPPQPPPPPIPRP